MHDMEWDLLQGCSQKWPKEGVRGCRNAADIQILVKIT